MANYRGRPGGAKGKLRLRRSTLSAQPKGQSSQKDENGRLAKVINLFKTAKRPR